MGASFNLIHKPFVSCRINQHWLDLNLADVLQQAHKIQELRDSSPLVTVALHRLLLAILHRVFGPASAAKWKQLWDGRQFPADPLQAYLQKWQERFDLFDEAQPFFQDGTYQAKSPGGINQLVRELSRGNNATLFDHTFEAPPPLLPPAEVARYLIAEQAFALGGGKSELGYTSGSPLAGGMVVLVLGENLFDTLMLNLVRYPHDSIFVFDDDDAPAWEQDDRPVQGTSSPNGYLDYLTWQSRSIHLHPEEDGRVKRMSYAQGRKFKPKDSIYDPMMAYKRDDKGDRSIRLSEAKELWRDSAALFQFAENEAFRGPTALQWLGELHSLDYIPNKAYSLAVIGLSNDKAKVNFWRHETLPLPLDYLTDNQLVQSLKKALELAEKVGQTVRNSTAVMAKKMLAPGEMPPDKDRVWAMVDSLAPDRLYWSRLEEPFRQFLISLPGSPEHQKTQMDGWFSRILKRTAWNVFHETAGQLDHSARVLRAVVEGEGQLRKSLGKIAKDANIERPVEQGVAT